MPPKTHSLEGVHQAVNDIHVYGVITIVLELCLCLENFLPVLVVFCWRRPGERTVADKLVAALSVTYILSALVPTPLGLASYFHGSWYGGAATCECFQVTSTWCSLSALAVVTFLAVDLQMTTCARAPTGHVPLTCSTWCWSPQRREGSCSSKDYANLVLFLLFTVTLAIASLPVAGYGPDVMPHNYTCDSWLIDTPETTKRRTYSLAFLAFGFLNLLTVLFTVAGTCLTLKRLAKWATADNFRYTENQSPPLLEPESLEDGYKMAGLICANQAMWIPALVIVTIQKVGYPVSDATVMYAVLTTSLPGLLNPVLLGLLFRDYRLGYRYVITRSCCCSRGGTNSSSMKNLQCRSQDSLHRNQADGEDPHECCPRQDDVTSCGRSHKVYSGASAASDCDAVSCHECNSYLVVEQVVMPNERTPLQGSGGAPSRPMVASMYDEYGELCHEAKTELLSPCGSEECLLNPEIFRAQSESVV